MKNDNNRKETLHIMQFKRKITTTKRAGVINQKNRENDKIEKKKKKKKKKKKRDDNVKQKNDIKVETRYVLHDKKVKEDGLRNRIKGEIKFKRLKKKI